MQYNMTFRGLSLVLNGIMKKEIRDSAVRKEIRKLYKQILLRAGDIGSKNRLNGSYGLAAWFIAMNRCDSLSPEENCRILEEGLRGSRLFKMTMGDAKSYFSEKNMESRRQWSRETYERKYKNDWVVDVLEKTDDYQFGFDYRECGVCKLCADEGCPELARYLCRLDYMIVDIMGIQLNRTMTLAEGGEKCDFRFVKK